MRRSRMTSKLCDLLISVTKAYAVYISLIRFFELYKLIWIIWIKQYRKVCILAVKLTIRYRHIRDCFHRKWRSLVRNRFHKSHLWHIISYPLTDCRSWSLRRVSHRRLQNIKHLIKYKSNFIYIYLYTAL